MRAVLILALIGVCVSSCGRRAPLKVPPPQGEERLVPAPTAPAEAR